MNKKIFICAGFLAVFSMFGFAMQADALTITRDLTIGATGSDVKSLQQFLNNSGYTVATKGVGSKGYETYTFGYLTQAAVKRYQSANGLSATGIIDSATRSKLAGSSSSYSGYTIEQLQAIIASLQQQIMELLSGSSGSSSGNPYITSIKITNGGDDDYIDTYDEIEITFSEAIDPESVNDDLDEGTTITGITFSETGGVSLSSGGEMTIKNIASFWVGDVYNSSLFTSKLKLSSNGKVLTITLTYGNDVEVDDEDFDGAIQIGGTIKDLSGNEMKNDSSILDPYGTFIGDNDDDDDDEDGSGNSSDEISIDLIKITNGGDSNYIDPGDKITITFDNPVKPSSINSNLDTDSYVTGIGYSEIGGVQVSSSGKVTIKGIAKFDMGSVEDSATFIVKLSLSSSGKVLTIEITSGLNIEIINEDFSDTSQIGGYIENEDGYEMESDSSINDPTGTFGGGGNGDGPVIDSIYVVNGGDDGYIDVDDEIRITFDREIDPESINDDLDEDDYVANVYYYQTGGVSVSSSGVVTIKNIATFDMGSVTGSANYVVRVALSSNSQTLTIILTSGSDIGITEEDFSDATQIGGYVDDEDGDQMESDSSINDPTGTFGGENDSYNGPSISSIDIYNGDDNEYIDEDDYIRITFNKAIRPGSINSGLVAGDSVQDIVSGQTGGVSVSSSGVVTIKNIASFDVGSVEDSGSFLVDLELSSSGKILTIRLTSGDSIEITDEDYNYAKQLEGYVEDEDGNEMEYDSSIDDPNGEF